MLALFTLLAGLSLAAAAPSSSPLLPRQASNGTVPATGAAGATTQLTFTGAGASVAVTAAVDGSTFQLPTPISVDTIAQVGQASCTFMGVDKAQLTVLGANTGATLAPPQVVVAGTCVAI